MIPTGTNGDVLNEAKWVENTALMQSAFPAVRPVDFVRTGKSEVETAMCTTTLQKVPASKLGQYSKSVFIGLQGCFGRVELFPMGWHSRGAGCKTTCAQTVLQRAVAMTLSTLRTRL